MRICICYVFLLLLRRWRSYWEAVESVTPCVPGLVVILVTWGIHTVSSDFQCESSRLFFERVNTVCEPSHYRRAVDWQEWRSLVEALGATWAQRGLISHCLCRHRRVSHNAPAHWRRVRQKCCGAHAFGTFSPLTSERSTWPLAKFTERKRFWTVGWNWRSNVWCVSSLRADWLIAIYHSNLGDTLILSERKKCFRQFRLSHSLKGTEPLSFRLCLSQPAA